MKDDICEDCGKPDSDHKYFLIDAEGNKRYITKELAEKTEKEQEEWLKS